MAKKTKITFQDKKVDATELEFKTISEDWNKYECEDGSIIKLKTVAAKIFRTSLKKPDGEPLYVIRSSNIADVTVGEEDKDVH